MKIFMTGATGVVGRRAIPLLKNAGHEVTAVARRRAQATDLARAGARPVEVDLIDRGELVRALAGHDALVNLATHVPHSTVRMLLPGAWRENDGLRRDASRVLVAAAMTAGVGRFIQESFALTYPDRGDSWIDENTPLQPVSYNRSVADAEASAQRFADAGGAAVVLRFGAFYGPDAFQCRAMLEAVRRGWAPLPGRPDAFYSSLSHDDAARAVARALGAPPGTYNVVDDEPLTRAEVARLLAAALRVPPPRTLPSWLAALTGSLGELMSRSQRIANRKLRAVGWTPSHPSLREGLSTFLPATRPEKPSADDRSANAL